MIFQFNQITLDVARYRLCLSGKAISVEPLVFDLLVYLIENRDQVVTRDELLEKLWKGKVVTDAALGACLKDVRKAVGDDGDRQEVIKTFYGRGYQFIAEVTTPADTQSWGRENQVFPERRNFPLKKVAVVAAIMAMSSLVLYTFWITQQENAIETTAQSTFPEQEQPSIAVLPFQVLGDNSDQDYFSDGITNNIITDLSKFSNLRVIASNSVFTYKGKPVKIKQVGKELSVQYVLEGSTQKIGNKVRINVQLIDATTDHHLWAERYDFEIDDIFKIQDEITNAVVTSLQVVLTESEKNFEAIHLTDSTEALDLYLRGKTYLKGTKKAHLEARKLFDRAIKLDPEFAAAYAEKSFTYFSSFIMPMSRDPKVVKDALVAAERAVELDDRLPLAYARLAWAYFANRKHENAIASARRGVALGPNDAEANAQLGNILNWSGKPQEGRQYIEKAIRLNPHYPYYYMFYLGQSYYLQRNNEKAIELMKRVVTRAPYFLPVRRHLAVLYSENGMINEAKKQTKEVLRIFPGASIEDERARCFYRWTPDILKRFFTGLRKSGMPEGKAGEEPIFM